MATQTQTRTPTGDYEATSWTGNYTTVDEGVASHDGDSTVTYTTTTSGARRSCTSTNFSITSASVSKVSVRIVAKYSTAVPISVTHHIYTWTTVRQGSALSLTTSYATYTTDWLTNPATGAAWTEEEVEKTDPTSTHRLNLDGRGFGVYVDCDTGGRVDVTAMDITVTYDDGASSSAIKTAKGLAKASVKVVDGLAIASVKTMDGLA